MIGKHTRLEVKDNFVSLPAVFGVLGIITRSGCLPYKPRPCVEVVELKKRGGEKPKEAF